MDHEYSLVDEFNADSFSVKTNRESKYRTTKSGITIEYRATSDDKTTICLAGFSISLDAIDSRLTYDKKSTNRHIITRVVDILNTKGVYTPLHPDCYNDYIPSSRFPMFYRNCALQESPFKSIFSVEKYNQLSKDKDIMHDKEFIMNVCKMLAEEAINLRDTVRATMKPWI